jgi:hypothetical protein
MYLFDSCFIKKAVTDVRIMLSVYDESKITNNYNGNSYSTSDFERVYFSFIFCFMLVLILYPYFFFF